MIETYADDQILIERFQRGDADAIEQLIGNHRSQAYQFALKLTRSHEEAGDVVAEAFLRVYRSIGRFQGKSSFSTWLYRIVSNCHVDMKKKERRRPTVSLDAPVEHPDNDLRVQIVDDGPSLFDSLFRKEQSSALKRVVDKLPKISRTLILMYHSEMLTYEQIAQKLRLPIGTVKSRLYRARVALRNVLEAYPGHICAA